MGLKFQRADPLTRDEPTRTKYSHSPPPNQYTKLTHCSIYVSIRTISFHRQNERAHPSWAPTKEPTVSCWRYTPTPKQDRFQDLLEAICPDFLSLSNIPKWDSNFSKPTHSRGTNRLGQNIPTPPPNQYTKLTHCSIYVSIQTISFHRQNERAHPSWAPTKEPTVSCWRYTPTPKQDRFQDLLEAICPDFLHTTLTK